MNYIVKCSCGQQMAVQDSQVGLQFACSACHRPFSIPANPTGAAIVPISSVPLPPAPIPQQQYYSQPQGHVFLTTQAKNPGVAAVLSFLYCGLGQIYNGQIGKGIVFLLLYSFCWILCLLIIGFILVPIVWIIGMIDAYTSAESINRQQMMRMGGPRY